jgi:hypothetical protein
MKMDPCAKMGGGTMSACITNQYERNFMLEAALNDLRFKERKGPKRQINGSGAARMNKTADSRARNAKRVLKIIEEKEKG